MKYFEQAIYWKLHLKANVSALSADQSCETAGFKAWIWANVRLFCQPFTRHSLRMARQKKLSTFECGRMVEISTTSCSAPWLLMSARAPTPTTILLVIGWKVVCYVLVHSLCLWCSPLMFRPLWGQRPSSRCIQGQPQRFKGNNLRQKCNRAGLYVAPLRSKMQSFLSGLKRRIRIHCVHSGCFLAFVCSAGCLTCRWW